MNIELLALNTFSLNVNFLTFTFFIAIFENKFSCSVVITFTVPKKRLINNNFVLQTYNSVKIYLSQITFCFLFAFIYNTKYTISL